MDIIMIRHGQSEDNVQKIYSRDDTSLTDQGIKQVKETKKLLKNFNFHKIYYSPLRRTVETLETLGLTGTEDLRIKEINFGIFTGKTFEEIQVDFPDETRVWIDDTQNYIIPNGESLLDVYKRVVEFLEKISKLNENVLLITHDSVIRLALCWVFNNIDYFYKFKVDNGSINIISIEDGFRYIKKLNLTSYSR